MLVDRVERQVAIDHFVTVLGKERVDIRPLAFGHDKLDPKPMPAETSLEAKGPSKFHPRFGDSAFKLAIFYEQPLIENREELAARSNDPTHSRINADGIAIAVELNKGVPGEVRCKLDVGCEAN